jgi:hypothetical protein
MTTIEQGITARLKGHTGLTALIGTRVFEGGIPQGETLPCVTYNRISTPRYNTHDTSGATGLASPRFQFDAWAATYTSARAISDQIRSALNGYKGAVTVGTGSITIQAALVEDERVNHSPDTGLKCLSSDYFVWHEE